ncbi:MAG: DNA polymerase/3'-5' exonuclease PolX [Phycisphaerae bacterium]
MINGELSRAFELIGDLLEITGADRFRINSYRRAARVVKECPEDLSLVAAEGRLGTLAGVGKSTAAKIEQFIETGTIDLLDELSAELPEGLPALLEVPGLGPKKVAALHHELQVGSLKDLKRAIKDGSIEKLAGFGATSVKRVADGIALLEASAGRTPLGLAMPIAESLAAALLKLEPVRRVAVAGSLRRGAETVGDIDLLCDSDRGEDVIQAFVQQPGVKRVLGSGATKGSISLELPSKKEVCAQLRVVPAESFGAALQYFTGSKEHNVRLREMAVKKGWKLNEWGLFDGESQIAGADEAEIYEKLGLALIPPELREDRWEFEKGFDPSTLIQQEQIRGDLHMHTTASDGRSTIEEMTKAAKALGYEYIAICDHSKSSTIANGLSIERMTRHIQAIRTADKKVRGIAVLAGCECDVLADGSLDYPDDILAQCDWVVASIHSALSGGKVPPTERTLRAMHNPYVCVIGHPTGRLINRRAPMKLDMAAVVRAAAETGTALEINASWQRLDLKDLHVHQALQAGAWLSINTDAHSTDGLKGMANGVTTARRGGAPTEQVLNTLSLADLRAWVAKKRTGVPARAGATN